MNGHGKQSRYRRIEILYLVGWLTLAAALLVNLFVDDGSWKTTAEVLLVVLAGFAWIAVLVRLFGTVRSDPQLSDEERKRYLLLLLLLGPIFPVLLMVMTRGGRGWPKEDRGGGCEGT